MNDRVTDLWFRSSHTLEEIAHALSLTDLEVDAEDQWEWVLGNVGAIRLDLTRAHVRPRRVSDVRIFRLDEERLDAPLIALLVERCRPLALDAIKCGRWTHRAGNTFNKTVVSVAAEN